jgi:hypothetical protein
MADPLRYVNGVMTAAREAPELIHLLRLTDEFPEQSIKAIRQVSGRANTPELNSTTSTVQRKNASQNGRRMRTQENTAVLRYQNSNKNNSVEIGKEAKDDGDNLDAAVNNVSIGVDMHGGSKQVVRKSVRSSANKQAIETEPMSDGSYEQPWEDEFKDEPRTKDAGTETPTHFVERNIDPSYEWNEWALRRRALQMTNIRNCATTGAQTDLSHFRRENDSQVYLPKTKVTQTRKDGSTQPPIITQYVAGLRGTPDFNQPSRYAAERTGKPGVLNLVLEPGAKTGHVVVGGRSHAF